MLPFSRLFHFGPLIALFVIFVCYFVSVIDSMIWFMPTHANIYGKLNLIVLTVWLSLILGNFFRAIFGGPGYVPTKWMPSVESDKKYLQFCQICQGYKPPRAHHCRICKRCVLKMDHHCPWINNCCGYRNHTNFVLFLFFAPVGCFHAFIVFVGTIYYQAFHLQEYYRISRRPVYFSMNAFFLTLFAAGLALGTIVAVGMLFYYQIQIILSNATGIEQWIIEKAEDRRNEDSRQFVYPYDYGKLKNISQVINMQCTPVGDGYDWEVVSGCSKYTLTIEQINQKIEKKERMIPFDIVKRYSGYWIPIVHGICTCLKIPCTDEPRISVKPGDRIIVSRGKKYWLYGNKVLSEQQVKEGERQRGWFPRNCAIRVPETELKSHKKSDK